MSKNNKIALHSVPYGNVNNEGAYTREDAVCCPAKKKYKSLRSRRRPGLSFIGDKTLSCIIPADQWDGNVAFGAARGGVADECFRYAPFVEAEPGERRARKEKAARPKKKRCRGAIVWADTEDQKQCRCCLQVLPRDKFTRRRGQPSSYCRECGAAKKREAYARLKSSKSGHEEAKR